MTKALIQMADRSSPVLFSAAAPTEMENVDTAEAVIGAAYRQVLKRNPDAAGLQEYRPKLESGSTSAKEIVRDLLHRAEWAGRFIHGRSVPETVLALYDCVLARAPDLEGWNHLTAWASRDGWSSVIDSMIDSAEYAQRFGAHSVPGQSMPGAFAGVSRNV